MRVGSAVQNLAQVLWHGPELVAPGMAVTRWCRTLGTEFGVVAGRVPVGC